jgi:hypothetical protein
MEYGSGGAFMMSPSLATDRLACWNCCHRPTSLNMGWETRAAKTTQVLNVPGSRMTISCDMSTNSEGLAV